MQRMRWIVIVPVFLFLLILTVLLIGCGGGSGGGSSNSNPITAPVTLSVSPTTASLGVGGAQTFTATVTNTAKTAVTWSVQEGTTGGTIDASGNYTAPNTIGAFHVVATSQADSTKTVTVPVTVHTLVAITPTTANLTVGGIQTFSASVTGSTNFGVTWGVLEGAPGGTISANGTYTAPNTAGTYHVTATSQADGTQASVTVTVQAAVPVGSATGTIH